jgi:magnesium-transporting ATPase (P-type)
MALGAGTAIAAVPEGLPLLASLGQAGVAQRLAGRKALVRRLSAVEALGRVDVACVDKTGTLTENRLSLQAVVAPDGSNGSPGQLSAPLREVLRCAAFASPPPGSSSAAAHATDMAVLEAARAAGLASGLDAGRAGETPFDATRPFHATLLKGRLCVKGSVEELSGRCSRVRLGDAEVELDARGRDELLERARRLAEEGLRVLLVAEGDGNGSVDDPRELVALGFLGIRDTVRASVAEAVERCRRAGIRLIMLTGDHPATARAIGHEIGLLDGGRVLTGPDIEHLADDELGEALEGVSVVSRIAPLEKLRIIEALRSRGHVVAMTGDGVNDGPALRLADVGVAMGRGGTEVARQAGDLVLVDDDFAVLVETLIEGRTFWANLRRSLAMLLGGNLGEVAFIVVLAGAGVAAPLTARQVLAVNLVSDVLPAISLVVQSPKRRDLSRLAREGDSALGGPLRAEIFTRAVATAVPAIAGYALARVLLAPARAQSVGFASIVVTQLAQTLDASRASGGISRSTTAAVAGTVAALAAALHFRPLGTFLGLTSPGALGWLLVAASAAAAPVVANRAASVAASETRLQLSVTSTPAVADAYA